MWKYSNPHLVYLSCESNTGVFSTKTCENKIGSRREGDLARAAPPPRSANVAALSSVRYFPLFVPQILILASLYP